jgi:hypothetical protein
MKRRTVMRGTSAAVPGFQPLPEPAPLLNHRWPKKDSGLLRLARGLVLHRLHLVHNVRVRLGSSGAASRFTFLGLLHVSILGRRLGRKGKLAVLA